jgi:hypothetical protein
MNRQRLYFWSAVFWFAAAMFFLATAVGLMGRLR